MMKRPSKHSAHCGAPSSARRAVRSDESAPTRRAAAAGTSPAAPLAARADAAPPGRRAARGSTRAPSEPARGLPSPRRFGAALALSVASLTGCGGGDESGASAAHAFAPPTVQLAYPAQPAAAQPNAAIAHPCAGHVPSGSTPATLPAAPPAVVSAGVAPTHAALRRPTIVLEFDRAIAPRSVAGVTLYDPNRASVAIGAWSWLSDRRLAFAPLTPLQSNSRYEIAVPAGIESAAGERSASPLTAQFDTAPTTPPRGLPNLGATCFINTALQLAVHSAALDDIVSNAAVDPAVRTLLDRYDAAPAAELDARLHAAVAALRATATIPDSGPGHTLDVLTALRLPLHPAGDADAIRYAPPDARAFRLHGWPFDYAALPNHERLVAFDYNAGGHYVAYVKRDGIWYCIDDAQVTPVTEQQLLALPAFNPNLGSMAIEIAIYR
ncbi:peptidase [Burkholderia thailandensis]|nr:peptidase [Burkholderia thailandensis]